MRQGHQVERKVDVSSAGAAPPTGAGGIDVDPCVAEPVFCRQFMKAVGEKGFGLFPQGFGDDLEEPGLEKAEVGMRRIGDTHEVGGVADEELFLCAFYEV